MPTAVGVDTSVPAVLATVVYHTRFVSAGVVPVCAWLLRFTVLAGQILDIGEVTVGAVEGQILTFVSKIDINCNGPVIDRVTVVKGLSEVIMTLPLLPLKLVGFNVFPSFIRHPIVPEFSVERVITPPLLLIDCNVTVSP